MSSLNYRRAPRPLAAMLTVATVVVGAAVWHARSAAEDTPPTPVPQTREHQKEQTFAKSLSHAFRTAANATMPSVVTITSEVRAQRVRGNVPQGKQFGGENPFKGTPFEDFFNDHNIPFDNAPQVPRGQHRTGVGAGVIIDKAGLVLTNNHVVEDATEVTVRLADGREYKGSDIKTDPRSDLAIVHIKGAEDLHAATLGNSDNLEIGDWVIAVGNPFNQEMTVSAGIISGKGRSLGNGGADQRRSRYLQTDAAINPGNSGGPLVDLDGEVVGINTAIASNSGGFQGVGFAIPINDAKWVVDQLIHNGSVKRAHLGVVVGELVGDLAEQLGAHRYEGVFVNQVLPDSPAAKAGIQEGDILTEFAGKHIGTPGQLQQLVERMKVNDKVDVKILRSGKPTVLAVAVEALPDKSAPETQTARGTERKSQTGPSFNSKEFGFEVADLTPAQAEQVGLPGVEGVIVTNVAPDGLAADFGITEGTVIKKVGNSYVKNVEQFKQAISGKTPEGGVMLLIPRSDRNDWVVLKK